MKRNMWKWIFFALVVIGEIVYLSMIRGDYRSTLIDGSEYKVPVSIDFGENFYNNSYLPVHISINKAIWKDDKEASYGETAYLVLKKDERGMMVIDHAQSTVPTGDYVAVKITYVSDSLIYFTFPADRMYMLPERLKKLSVVELSERVRVKNQESGKTETHMKNEVMAVLKVKNGKVAISQVLANGAPIEQTFTTIGKNLSVKYASSGGEKDEYNETRAFREPDNSEKSE